MNKLSLREKVLVIVLLIVAIIYGYYKFYLGPALTSIDEKKKSIATLKVQEQRIKDAPSVKEKLTSQLNEVTVLYNAAVLEIPQQYRNSEIAYDLKALCDANSTVLKSISLGAGSSVNSNPSQTSTEGGASNTTNAQASSGLYSVPVVLSITGSYNATMNLINAIENDTRTALIDTIGMAAGASGEGLTTNISLTFYYLDNGEKAEETYDFNKGTYGKTDLYN